MFWFSTGILLNDKVMKYDFVSQYAVNIFLEPFTECAHSERIRTDTTLDQDCVLKASVQVCTTCMIVSLLTTWLNSNTPHLAHIAPFRWKIRESNAEVPLDTKLSKHVCQLILVCTIQRSQAEYHSDQHGSCTNTMVQTKCLLSLSSSRIIGFSEKFCANSPLGVGQSTNCLLLVAVDLLVLCSLLS